MYSAQVICDSISPQGVRLTTIEVEYPHAIHKDVMTHRAFSRNFQSFRAYPPEKVIEKIEADPFWPEVFEARVKGMGQGEAVPDLQQAFASSLWQEHINHTLKTARAMLKLDLAKAQVNFPLQDLTSIRGVITATEWDNFFALRLAIDPETGKPYARPEVYKIAAMMKEAYDHSTPDPLKHGEWHLPYIDVNDYRHFWLGDGDLDDAFPFQIRKAGFDWESLKKISTGRCARISYLTHDGKRDWSRDIGLYTGLRGDFHMSPFEHQATPIGDSTPLSGLMIPMVTAASATITGTTYDHYYDRMWSGNFRGWQQHRKEIPGEANAATTSDYILDVVD